MIRKSVVGIDIGGTNTDIGLVSSEGTVISRSRLTTCSYSDFDRYIKDICHAICEMERSVGVEVEGIGIGTPNANFLTGCVENAVNLPMKGVLNFREKIQRYIDVPVTLSNDADAAAYGEMVYGGAKGMTNFIVFTLGTGVGSGIVVDGHIVRGYSGSAGELGHSILIPDGRSCGCGRQGCLEAYVSASGIVRTFCEQRKRMGYSSMNDGWIGNQIADLEITSKLIGDAAKCGDPVACYTYQLTAQYLSLAMANAVTFSSPEAVFLTGGPAQVGDPLLVPLQQCFQENLLFVYKGTCQLLCSSLNTNDAAILGSAALLEMNVR